MSASDDVAELASRQSRNVLELLRTHDELRRQMALIRMQTVNEIERAFLDCLEEIRKEMP